MFISIFTKIIKRSENQTDKSESQKMLFC
uniref:Uncharacterized protein n=1 Tax=Anguilla anguilla TaxID=7936 RepID=A0A0E9QDY1_ANGAN